MANVGKNIKKLRTNCKMTQDALAEQLFVSRQTVSNYENGKTNPDIDMLIKMAEIFGTDVNALIYGPTVPTERKIQKQEYIKLGIVAALLALVGISAIVFEKTGMAEWFYYRFISWPAIILNMLAKPFTCVGLGWLVMQAAYLFFGAKRPKILQGKAVQICRRILIAVLILYVILILPPLIKDGIEHWHSWQAELQGRNYSYVARESVLPREVARFLTWMWYKILLINKSYSVLYILPGIFLWASAPKAKQTLEKESVPKKSEVPERERILDETEK